MNKTATIRARTNPQLKEDVEKVFKKLGISASQAINMFYSQVKIHNGLPFEVSIPNKETEETFQKTDQGKEIHKFSTTKEMFKELDI